MKALFLCLFIVTNTLSAGEYSCWNKEKNWVLKLNLAVRSYQEFDVDILLSQGQEVLLRNSSTGKISFGLNYSNGKRDEWRYYPAHIDYLMDYVELENYHNLLTDRHQSRARYFSEVTQETVEFDCVRIIH
jgi:hypothetical protein